MSSPSAKSMYAQVSASAHSRVSTGPQSAKNGAQHLADKPPESPQGELPEDLGNSQVPENSAFPAVLESFWSRYQVDAGQTGAILSPLAEGQSGGRPSEMMRAFQEVRIFHGRAFVREVVELAGQLSPTASEGLLRTGHDLWGAFSQGSSRGGSALAQFSRQSAAMAVQGEEALKTYLGAANTAILAGGGAEVSRFLDHVDSLLTTRGPREVQGGLAAYQIQTAPLPPP